MTLLYVSLAQLYIYCESKNETMFLSIFLPKFDFSPISTRCAWYWYCNQQRPHILSVHAKN